MLMDFACTVSFAKLFQSRMILDAKKCTRFETAGAFFFVGIKDSAHPGLID